MMVSPFGARERRPSDSSGAQCWPAPGEGRARRAGQEQEVVALRTLEGRRFIISGLSDLRGNELPGRARNCREQQPGDQRNQRQSRPPRYSTRYSHATIHFARSTGSWDPRPFPGNLLRTDARLPDPCRDSIRNHKLERCEASAMPSALALQVPALFHKIRPERTVLFACLRGIIPWII